ncbi:axin interactor, dorsalization-associated protein-like [Branchiostoma lanceolatum]|uniref:AIDA protein n=1 Tax=Branchiostoma lanceolatum TaxID=7740 RepID=A0A8K0EP54_BRALA|nr:AIDA [Branchiostoma lanceolatum]
MSEKTKQVAKWHGAFKKATDFDSWGQLVEAVDEYQMLSRQLRKEGSSSDSRTYTDDQKRILSKVSTCLDLRSQALQAAHGTSLEDSLSLEELKKVEPMLKNLLDANPEEFPVQVSHFSPVRRPTGPEVDISVLNLDGEEEEEEETRGERTTPTTPKPTSGSLLPRLPPEPGMTNLTLRIERIGLKDAGQHIDPYVTVSVKDVSGIDLTEPQDTPIASKKEDPYVYFNVDVEIQRHVEKMPKGTAIFFEFKHYKPKKRMTSIKCWAFMEMDELKSGPASIELYKKPTDFKRKKVNLLTVKPLFLELYLTLTKD